MNPNYNLLIEMRDTILDYLEEQKSINEDALKAYEPMPIQDNDPEVKLMRERERIKINDRVYELKRHIGVIKRMYPNEK
jgi:hypothetical protein